MDILIIADFCGKMDGNGNSRFLYLANMLSCSHEVEVLTSDFDHGSKSFFTGITSIFPFKITMVHEGLYKKNVSLRRFYGHYVWAKNVQTYLKTRKKPDVIYAAVPPLLAPYFAAKYCKKNNIRFIIDIQDLWPEAFKMVFKVPVISNIFFAPFNYLANGVYKGADEIIAVSDTYVNRALQVNVKCNKGLTVFLGTELAIFDKNAKENAIKKEDELWLGYCGSMGDSYDLKCVIDALAKLKNPPKLIAMGDGEKRREFENYAVNKGVKSVFTGNLPYNQMCGHLIACDIVVNPIVGSSAASIINKHSDYAASGLPVINTQESDEYRKLVETYHMGFNCKNGDSDDFADKLQVLIENKDLRLEMGKNARRCAEERFDRAVTYRNILNLITRM